MKTAVTSTSIDAKMDYDTRQEVKEIPDWERVFLFFEKKGESCMSEVCAELGMKEHVVSARINELKNYQKLPCLLHPTEKKKYNCGRTPVQYYKACRITDEEIQTQLNLKP